MKNNTFGICNEHATKRHKDWQEDNTDTIIKVGDHVKVEFKDNSIKCKEHMWVLITDVKGDVFKGTLDNVPVHLTNYMFAQEVTVKRSQIEQHIGY